MRGMCWAGLAVGLLLLGGCAQAPATPAATLVPPVAPTSTQAPAPTSTAATQAAVAATPAASAPALATSATAAQRPASAAPAQAPAPASAPVRAGALFLAVTSPADDLIEVPAGTRTVVVAGNTAPDALVSVNGFVAGVDATGAFQVTVPLDEDVTLLDIVASDDAGKQVQTDRIVVQE